MQTRSKQALRVAAAGALLALIGAGAQAAPPTPRDEKSLVGIRLHASFSDVLRKFGQPTEIQIGEPVVSALAQGGQQGASRGMQGGLPGGMGGMGAMFGKGGGMPGAMGGAPMGGPPGMPGAMGGQGMPPGLPPSMQSGFRAAMSRGQGGAPMGGPSTIGGGMPGGMSMPGAMAGGMGRLPGFQGGNAGGGPNLPGVPGGGGGFPGFGMNMGNANSQAVAGNETTWWYHFPKQGLHYSFLFNRQGRVIQIQAYGYKAAPNIPAARTAEGITLGASLGDVIQRYGWSSDGEHTGDYVVLRYGARDQIAFQSRHNQVIGIVLGLVNP